MNAMEEMPWCARISVRAYILRNETLCRLGGEQPDVFCRPPRPDRQSSFESCRNTRAGHSGGHNSRLHHSTRVENVEPRASAHSEK